jgi:hypothetical protein
MIKIECPNNPEHNLFYTVRAESHEVTVNKDGEEVSNTFEMYYDSLGDNCISCAICGSEVNKVNIKGDKHE